MVERSAHPRGAKGYLAAHGLPARSHLLLVPHACEQDAATMREERVEADAHRIDAIFTILIPSIFGNIITKTVDRLWVIVLKDIAISPFNSKPSRLLNPAVRGGMATPVGAKQAVRCGLLVIQEELAAGTANRFRYAPI
jgi:hypothetical protein